MLPDHLRDTRIGILGFGTNNRELTRWLLRHGASEVVVYDEKLSAQEIIDWLDGDVEVVVGPKAFSRIDVAVAFRSPGLALHREELQAAASRGVRLSSQTALFLELCPARTIGITGTKGKGTTSTLIARMLEQQRQSEGARSRGGVYLAGNIGTDPFSFMDDLSQDDLVVLELSSFQLDGITNSPRIAVVLGVAADHLDYHPSLEHYQAAKVTIVRHQYADDSAVLNLDNATSLSFAEQTAAHVYYTSRQKAVDQGAYLKQESFVWRDAHAEEVVATLEDLQLRGGHNVDNALAAIAAAKLAGASTPAIRQALREFVGLPMRLEKCLEHNGIQWYNDSLATGPGPTVAALESFLEPIVLIAGGSDKGLDYLPLGQAIAKAHVRALITIGATGPVIAAAAEASDFPASRVTSAETLERAVRMAQSAAKPGDVILFSPASASFDQFPNAKVRGRQFHELVQRTVQR